MYDEVVKYIKEAKEYGLTEREIKQNLLNAGWEAELVEQAFVHAKAEAHKLFENKDEDIVLPQDREQSAKPVHEEMPGPVQTHQLESKKEQPQPFQDKESQVETAGAIHMEAQSITAHHEEMLKHNKGFQKKLIVGLVAILLLGAGGYFFYSYVYANPAKIWNNFISREKNKSFNSIINISYKDDPAKIIGKELKDPTPIEITLNFESANDIIDEENANMDVHASFNVSAGETQFQQGLNFMIVDNIFYLKISDIPEAKNLFLQEVGEQADWIKIDYKKVQEELENISNVLGASIVAQNVDNSEIPSAEDATNNTSGDISENLKNELENIWKDFETWRMEKYLGIEKINGVKTAHFKNSLDKETLKNNIKLSLSAIINSFTKQLGMSDQTTLDEFESLTDSIAQFVDKIEVKEFETWIGVKDFQLYKLHLLTSAPSFNSIMGTDAIDSIPVLDSARKKSRDAIRLADIRQMAAALELFFNDKNGYPDGINGIPEDLSPFYISIVPTAPNPADGQCSDYYNTYWYEPKGEPVEANGIKLYPDYEYTFCLGDDTGGYSAGIARMTNLGIEPNITCTGTEEQCSGQIITDNEDLFSQLNFTAEFKINAEFSNYGQQHQFVVPEGAVDILGDAFQDSQASIDRDKIRLGSVRQIMTALELYFNEYGRYPEQLSGLTAPVENFGGVSVLSEIPKAPEPPDGHCTLDQNIYSYQQLNNGQSYEIDFCLGSEYGGYAPGVHKVTPSGIQ